MNIGTKSLLFGVHQFMWHPFTVWLAWRKLYGRPSANELICIVIHDWGYWNKPNMDGAEGEKHPEFAADLAARILGAEYGKLCRYHSRHYSRNEAQPPSSLCWADKLSILYDPWWLYLPRAWLSGELHEYRQRCATAGLVPGNYTHREWFAGIRDYLQQLGESMDPDCVPYANEKRGESR